ncbi:MAG: hypothetical protein HGB30_13075, partial [Holophagaceae bacterium]|nr:hypothetical protein [Holophagaceae bacterium]
PQIALDDQGNALAAWHHRSEDGEGIYICRYHPDQRGWDVVPRRLDSARTQAQAPEIAMNCRCELAVVWHEQEGPLARVCARHMLGSEDTWVPYPLHLQEASGQVSSLHAAMDPQGNIQVVWCLGEPGAYQVYTSGYWAAEATWDLQATPLGLPSPRPLFPQLAMNRAGTGLAVWSTEGEPEGDGLVACHYDPGSRSWSDRPTAVAPGRAAHLRLALDARGNAIVLWVEAASGGQQQLRASHLDGLSIEWTPVAPLAVGPDIRWPQVGLDGHGRAHAVWRQEAAGRMKLYAKRCSQGQWDPQRTLLVDDVGQSQAHALSTNEQGHALVVWLQDQGDQSLVCARRFDGQAWGARPVLLGAPSHREVQTPGAMLSPGDQIGVIWRQGDPQHGAILTAVGQA